MNLGRRSSTVLFTSVIIIVLLMIVQLPYDHFGWSIAQAVPYTRGGSSSTPIPPAFPANLVDIKTAPAYTDSNAGLTTGQLYAVPISTANVGNRALLRRGFVAAADFQIMGGNPFGPFPVPVRACVRGKGKPVFIPKVPYGTGVPVDYPVAPADSPEVTCVFIFSPGIVALVEN